MDVSEKELSPEFSVFGTVVKFSTLDMFTTCDMAPELTREVDEPPVISLRKGARA